MLTRWPQTRRRRGGTQSRDHLISRKRADETDLATILPILLCQHLPTLTPMTRPVKICGRDKVRTWLWRGSVSEGREKRMPLPPRLWCHSWMDKMCSTAVEKSKVCEGWGGVCVQPLEQQIPLLRAKEATEGQKFNSKCKNSGVTLDQKTQ